MRRSLTSLQYLGAMLIKLISINVVVGGVAVYAAAYTGVEAILIVWAVFGMLTAVIYLMVSIAGVASIASIESDDDLPSFSEMLFAGNLVPRARKTASPSSRRRPY